MIRSGHLEVTAVLALPHPRHQKPAKTSRFWTVRGHLPANWNYCTPNVGHTTLIHHIFLACDGENGENFRTGGRGDGAVCQHNAPLKNMASCRSFWSACLRSRSTLAFANGEATTPL